jgi:hypothetical protein
VRRVCRSYVFRTSELDRTLSNALAGRGHSPKNLSNRNVAEKKAYSELYNDVVSRVRVPAQLADAIYTRI